jgi:hypothetical protein
MSGLGPTLTTSCRAIRRQLIWVDRWRYQHGREGNQLGHSPIVSDHGFPTEGPWRENLSMNTPRSDRLTEEQWPEAVRYVGAIFLSGAVLRMLLTLRILISPPSKADLCGDEAAMCCRLCAAFAWFKILPFAAFFFALIFFLPGFVTVRSIARSVAWWRPAYWIPGWVVTGVVAAVLLAVVFAITHRKIIALNIHNGILR